jgi:hypothetical protein
MAASSAAMAIAVLLILKGNYRNLGFDDLTAVVMKSPI